jgi:NAD(P)-dependent dehydrogenase (short-subunit alcohol dehydrogenase family)
MPGLDLYDPSGHMAVVSVSGADLGIGRATAVLLSEVGASHALMRPGGHALMRPGGHALMRPGGHALMRPGGHALMRPGGHALMRPGGDALVIGWNSSGRDGTMVVHMFRPATRSEHPIS